MIIRSENPKIHFKNDHQNHKRIEYLAGHKDVKNEVRFTQWGDMHMLRRKGFYGTAYDVDGCKEIIVTPSTIGEIKIKGRVHTKYCRYAEHEKGTLVLNLIAERDP